MSSQNKNMFYDGDGDRQISQDSELPNKSPKYFLDAKKVNKLGELYNFSQKYQQGLSDDMKQISDIEYQGIVEVFDEKENQNQSKNQSQNNNQLQTDDISKYEEKEQIQITSPNNISVRDEVPKQIYQNNSQNQQIIHQYDQQSIKEINQCAFQQLGQLNCSKECTSLGQSIMNLEAEENVDDHVKEQFDDQNQIPTEIIGQQQKKIKKKVFLFNKKQKIKNYNNETKNLPSYYERVIRNYVNGNTIQKPKKNITISSLRNLLKNEDVREKAESYFTSFQFLDDLLTSEKQLDIAPPIKYLNKIYQETIKPNSLFNWVD